MYKQVISINGVPRSGTSWLGQIINSSSEVRFKFQPLFSYKFKDYINIRSTKEEIYEFYDKLYSTKDEFLDQTNQIEEGKYPNFNKVSDPKYLTMKMVRYHYLLPKLVEETSNIKIIGIIRNPLSVLSSWKNAPKELPPELNFQKEWKYAPNRNKFQPEEYFGFVKWKEFVFILEWLKEKYPEKVYIINYEDLVNETEKYTKEIFDFCNLQYEAQTKNFIRASQSLSENDPYSVYKGKVDLNKWRQEIPESIITEVEKDLKFLGLDKYLN